MYRLNVIKNNFDILFKPESPFGTVIPRTIIPTSDIISESYIYHALFEKKYADLIYRGIPSVRSSVPPFVLDLDRYLTKASDRVPGLGGVPYLGPIFSAYGCLGLNNTYHRQIAADISGNLSLDFNLLLGDNVYHHGVQEPSYTLKVFYDDIYKATAKKAIKLSFACLGNHDYNYCGRDMSLEQSVEGPWCALKQVNYTYQEFPTYMLKHI